MVVKKLNLSCKPFLNIHLKYTYVLTTLKYWYGSWLTQAYAFLDFIVDNQLVIFIDIVKQQLVIKKIVFIKE